MRVGLTQPSLWRTRGGSGFLDERNAIDFYTKLASFFE
jgi:hypothetical protein